MSFAGFRPIPLPKLGGLFTFLKPLDVPSGYSPNLQNVRFLPRAFLSRPGMTPRMTKNGVNVSSIAQFISNSGTKILVSLDANGSIDFQDSTTGNPDALMSNVSSAGSLMHSHTKFGRTFFSFFNNDLSPAGLIRQWNGVRQAVAPSQPLAVITVVDSATADANWIGGGAHTYKVQILFETVDNCFLIASQQATWNSAGGFQPTITGIPVGSTPLNVVARWVCFSYPDNHDSGGNTITFLLRFPQFRIADNITTTLQPAGIGNAAAMEADGAYIDQLQTSAVNAPCLPHIAPDGPAAAPTAADSVNAGSIAVGVHQVWQAFETIFGFITCPSPAGNWTAAGGKKGLITKLAIGPWYVTARRLFFSSSAGQDALYVSTFRVPNNTTTSVEVDFTDTSLLQGSNVNYLFKNFAMPPAIGVSSYGGRLCTWGALNQIQATTGVDNTSVVNLGFDGGFDLSTGAPMGWTLDGGFGAGGDKEVFNTWAGDAWRFTGDGATAKRGMINNTQLVSRNMLNTNTSYSVSFRLRGDAGQTVGSVVVELFSASLGLLGQVKVLTPNITTSWTEFNGQLTLGLASIPADLVLRTSTSNDTNPVPLGVKNWIDDIRIYPTLSKVNNSTLRVGNPFDTETFDNTNGFQLIAKDNGEAIAAVSQLRSFLYVLKERSMHVTYDDTTNPPSLWINRQIDSTIGTGNPRSVVSSDTFIAFASRGGGYMFTGSRPQKVTQEIQTTWNSINWSASGTVHTLMDTQAKNIFFFVPLNSDVSPHNALVLDYSEGLGTEDDPGPRKWGKDLYPFAVTGSLKVENSATTHALFGVVSNTQSIYICGPKVYEFVGADDDGNFIDWFYDTAFLKAGETGQDLFGGAQFYAEGSGALIASLIGLDDVQQQGLTNVTLTSAPGQQFEVYANMEIERAKLRFEQTADGASCTIKGITLMAIPWADQRIH